MTRFWNTMSTDEIVALPLDELAQRVLQDAIEQADWNFRNALLLAKQEIVVPAAVRALAEAWNWLFANGLVASDPDQGNPDAIFVTRLGHRVAEGGLEIVRAIERIGVDLHPLLEREVRPQFLMGKYEMAAFAAMRQVEIRVRELTGTPPSNKEFGVALMRWAFGDGGPLEIPAEDAGERKSIEHLFAGAIGAFKNPPSHREVDYDDPTEAAEVVLLADLLMRILDRLTT